MKTVASLIISLLLAMSTGSYAAVSEFLCTEPSTGKWVRIVTETQYTPGIITYGVHDAIQQSFVLPNNIMERSPTDFELLPTTIKIGNELSVLVNVSIPLYQGGQATVTIIESQRGFSKVFAVSFFRCIEF
jgi:hypothetical protein